MKTADDLVTAMPHANLTDAEIARYRRIQAVEIARDHLVQAYDILAELKLAHLDAHENALMDVHTDILIARSDLTATICKMHDRWWYEYKTERGRELTENEQ